MSLAASRGFWMAMVLTMSGPAQAQPAAAGKWATLDGAPPIVIAHRGASGYRPEHTLASYQLAIELGADYIEPDLVATRDGHLIARHEPLLDDTTDVKSRPEFASRRTARLLDGKEIAGFYASDFTLAEIRQLRAVQPNPARSKEYDGQFGVPTFEEILDLVQQQSTQRGRRIGIYPETKHPAFHLALQLPLEDRLLEALQRRGLNEAGTAIFIQSFESANLQYLRPRTELPLVQLMDEGSLIYDDSGVRVLSVNIPDYGDRRGGQRPARLADVAKYANAIGPWKRQIVRDLGRAALLTTTVIEQAHAAGLRVHTYTFRNEPATLAPEYHNDPMNEYRRFYELGIDGVFSDFSDTALRARAEWASR
ncbi:MAG: glycerophosphodiester phosphodiesterase [Pseudomonadota bacterium]|nr:glycerophosphodiester phosphodiesterase [Pseudomonadota bacterium]